MTIITDPLSMKHDAGLIFEWRAAHTLMMSRHVASISKWGAGTRSQVPDFVVATRSSSVVAVDMKYDTVGAGKVTMSEYLPRLYCEAAKAQEWNAFLICGREDSIHVVPAEDAKLWTRMLGDRGWFIIGSYTEYPSLDEWLGAL
jgi:hypothetical protein